MLYMGPYSVIMRVPSSLQRRVHQSGWVKGLVGSRRRQYAHRASSIAEDTSIFAENESYVEEKEAISSAYVHLPFCKKKCLYCDFPVVAVGHGRKIADYDAQYKDYKDSMMTSYVDYLCKEMELTPVGSHASGLHTREESEDVGHVALKTLYFGGGTPSLLPLKELERILEVLRRRFGIEPTAEITIEADPGTFDSNRLKSYMNLGITRVSVGVQAFDDRLLELCGRSHALYDVYKAIEDVHAADVPSWSLDLISGLPELDMDAWERNIMCAIDAQSHHISSYDLQVEPGTPFHSLYRPGVRPLPSDDETASMYARAVDLFTAHGFDHYELSSYAKRGHQCVHNAVYWDGKGYHAFGMGASSYVHRSRVTRPRKFNAYLAWVKQFEESIENNHHPLPHVATPRATSEDVLTDMIMLQLRKASGLDLGMMERRFRHGALIKDAILDAISTSVERGLVEYDADNNVVKFIDPDGFLLSNDVISDIFVALDRLKT